MKNYQEKGPVPQDEGQTTILSRSIGLKSAGPNVRYMGQIKISCCLEKGTVSIEANEPVNGSPATMSKEEYRKFLEFANRIGWELDIQSMEEKL